MKRALVLMLAIGGCAGAQQPEVESSSTAEPERDASGYEARIAELQSELQSGLPSVEDESLALEMEAGPGEGSSSPPSRCSVAADLRDRICDLAGRICELAERSANDADAAGKCERGRASCSQARSDVARTCSGL